MRKIPNYDINANSNGKPDKLHTLHENNLQVGCVWQLRFSRCDTSKDK